MKQGIYDGEGPLTNQQKILAAQALIFAQAGAAQGDFARTGEGLANQQRIAAAQFENFKATLGTAFLPMVTTVVNYLNTTFIPALYGLLDGAKAAFNWIKDNSTWLVPLAIGLGVVYGGLLLMGLGMKIAETGVKGYAKATGQAMMAQLGLNAAMFANPIGLIILAVVALVAALVWFFTQTELGKQIWENVMNAIGMAMTWLWESVLKPVWDAILIAWQWLMDGFKFLWESVLKPVFDAISAIFTWIWETIVRPIIQAIMIIVLLLGMAFTWLWENAIKPAFDFIGAIFAWLWNTIIKIIVDLIIAYVKLWAAIFTWLYENILKPVFGFIADLFVWIWNNVVMPIVNLIVGIIQVMGAVFKWLYETIIKPVFDALGVIFNWLWKNIIQPVIGFITKAFEAIGKTASDIFNGIVDVVKSVFEGLLGIIRGPINAVIGFINMMIDGINSIKIDIPDFARDLFGGAASIGFNIPKIPALAKGGYVDQPTTALIGEAGPEVVTPLKDFERMMGLDGNRDNKVLNYYAAPNTSMDSEKELFDSMRRAKVVAGW
jgi:phage-related protein